MGFFKPNVAKMEKKMDTEGLKKALQYKDSSVRENAAFALDRLGWRPEDDTEKARYLIAKRDWDDLSGLGESAVEPLIKAMKDEDETIAEHAEGTLKKMALARPPWMVESLIQALKDETVQDRVAELLGVIGDARAVEPMIQVLKNFELFVLLDDDDPFLLMRVVKGLGSIGEPAVEPLIQALKSGPYINVKAGAALALGLIGDARAVEPLVQAIENDNELIGESVILALGEMGEPAVEPLLQILKGKDPSTLQVLQGKDPSTRYRAMEALGRIGDARAVEPLIQAVIDEKGFEHAVQALGRIGEPAVEPLIKALNDEDYIVRNGAAHALGLIGDARAVEPLIQILKDDEHSDAIAAIALGEIGDARAVEPLIQASKGKGWLVRKFAKEALEKIKANKS